MKPRTLGILLVATVIVVALAAIAASRGWGSAPRVETGPVAPGLKERINDVARVTIRTSDGTVTLTRADQAWAVAELGDYPARIESVRELILGIADLEKSEPKTGRPELFHRLGLRDPQEGGSRGRRVTLEEGGEGGAVLADVVVGDTVPGTESLYVRAVGGERSWLARGRVLVRPRAMDYVDRQLADIAAERVASVRIEHPDGSVLRLERAEPGGDLAVVDIPEGMRVRQGASPRAGALASLTLTEVKPVDEVDWTEAVEAEVRTFDGLVVRARTVEAGGDHWLTLTADAAEPGAEAEAGRLESRAGRWAVAVPRSRWEQLRTRAGELLEQSPPPNHPDTEGG